MSLVPCSARKSTDEWCYYA